MRHLDDGLLQAWLDRPRSGLEAGEYDRIERHLASCEACAGRVADLRDSTRRSERILAPSGAADEPVPPYEAVLARARRSGAGRRHRRRWIAAGWAASIAVALWGGWLAHDLIGPGPGGRSGDGAASATAEGPAEPTELARATEGEAPAVEAAGDEAPAVHATEETPVERTTDDRPETQVARQVPEEAPEAAGAVAERLAGAVEEQARAARIAEAAEAAVRPGVVVVAGEPMERRREADEAPVEVAQARADLAGRPSIVQGRVTSESGRPLAGSQVRVEGHSVGSVTGPDGRFTLNLRELPDSVARDLTVTATLIGYGRESRTPPPEGGDTASLDFRLPESAVALSEIVVTGVVAERAAAPREQEAVGADREMRETPPSITVPWPGRAPADWLPVRPADAEFHTGLPLLLVPGLEVVRVETARFDGFPVVRIVQELPGGEHLTLIEAAGPPALDGLPPREDLSVAYTRKDGIWIAGIAPLSVERLEGLLERVR